MEWVETTGKTVEEAKETALDQLGIDHDDAEFEVVEEPRAGLFGRLRGEARVRARVAPRAPRAKQERRNRRRSRHRGGAKATATNGTTSAARDGPGGSGNRKARGKGGAVNQRQARDEMSQQPENGPDRGSSPEPASRLSLADEGAIVTGFIEGLVESFGLDATVSTTEIEDDDAVEVAVDGPNLGLLVGPRGVTLGSLQELSRTVLRRQAGAGFQGRVRVDVGGYRARRQEALARFAARIADEVRGSGTEKALEPMNPSDRKVVHDTVNEIDGVETRSEGDEPRRHVVIMPAG